MSPRQYGQGSIFQRSDGRWSAKLSFDGQSKTVYGKTRAAVVAKLRELRKIRDTGARAPDDRYTVAQWLQDWLEGPVALSVRPNTARSYALVVRLYLTPTLGRVRLSRLSAEQVEAMLVELERAGVGERSRLQAFAVLRTALGVAMRRGYVPRAVTELVKPPRYTAPRVQPMESDKALALLEATRGDRLEALYSVALLGLRAGELVGLRWEDVDLERRSLVVQRQAQRIPGQGMRLSPLKTERSQRRLPLPDFTGQSLREHRSRQLEERLLAGSRWQDHGLVFPTTVGTLLDPVAVSHRFQDLLERNGLEHIRFHDLRHLAATILRANGVDLKLIQAILGHSSFAMTSDLYADSYIEELRPAADTLERIFGGHRG